MSGLGFERATQDRVLSLFQEKLGYRYLGDWKERSGNSNIDVDPVRPGIQVNGVGMQQIRAATAVNHAFVDIGGVLNNWQSTATHTRVTLGPVVVADTSTTCATMVLKAAPMAMPRARPAAAAVPQPDSCATRSSTAIQRGSLRRARRN